MTSTSPPPDPWPPRPSWWLFALTLALIVGFVAAVWVYSAWDAWHVLKP